MTASDDGGLKAAGDEQASEFLGGDFVGGWTKATGGHVWFTAAEFDGGRRLAISSTGIWRSSTVQVEKGASWAIDWDSSPASDVYSFYSWRGSELRLGGRWTMRSQRDQSPSPFSTGCWHRRLKLGRGISEARGLLSAGSSLRLQQKNDCKWFILLMIMIVGFMIEILSTSIQCIFIYLYNYVINQNCCCFKNCYRITVLFGRTW